MNSLIEVFRMEELSKETRVNVIIKLGHAINDEHGMNLTEPVVAELVQLLDPNHKILTEKRYAAHLEKPSEVPEGELSPESILKVFDHTEAENYLRQNLMMTSESISGVGAGYWLALDWIRSRVTRMAGVKV